MITIAQTARLFAFSFAVLLTYCCLIQDAPAQLIEITGFQATTESQEIITDENQPVHPPKEEWVLDSNHTWELDSDQVEIYSPTEAFDLSLIHI